MSYPTTSIDGQSEQKALEFFTKVNAAFRDYYDLPAKDSCDFIIVGHLLSTMPALLQVITNNGGTVAAIIPKSSHRDANIQQWLKENHYNVRYDLTKEKLTNKDEVLRLLEDPYKKFEDTDTAANNKVSISAKESSQNSTVNSQQKLAEQKNVTNSSSLGIIIIDIGGYFAQGISQITTEEIKKLKKCLLGIVEDTENGHQAYREVINQLPVPIYSVARSQLKQTEDWYVGIAIVSAVDAILRSDFSGSNILLSKSVVGIIGFGKIGKSAATYLKAMGCNSIYVYDTNPSVIIQTSAFNFKIATRAELLKEAQVIFCCTGNQALSVNDFEDMGNTTVIIASCTSADKEFDLKGMPLPIDREKKYAPRYLFNKRGVNSDQQTEIFLLCDGNAVNFFYNAVVGDYIRAVQGGLLVASLKLASNKSKQNQQHHNIITADSLPNLASASSASSTSLLLFPSSASSIASASCASLSFCSSSTSSACSMPSTSAKEQKEVKKEQQKKAKIQKLSKTEENMISRIWLREFEGKEIGIIANTDFQAEHKSDTNDKDLHKLITYLKDNSHKKLISIYGNIGTGKTRVVKHFLTKFHFYYNLIWIFRDDLNESYKQLAERLNISQYGRSYAQIKTEVNKKLKTFKNVLLIFDNFQRNDSKKDEVIDHDMFDAYRVEHCKEGKKHILLLSDYEIQYDTYQCTSLKISSFTGERAVDFFYNEFGSSQPEQSAQNKNLMETGLLDNNPFLLKIACAYLRTQSKRAVNIDVAIQFFNEKKFKDTDKILNENERIRKKLTSLLLVIIADNKIYPKDFVLPDCARTILFVSSYLRSINPYIPNKLVFDQADDDVASSIQQAYINFWRRLGLIYSVNRDTDSFCMHPLIQDIIVNDIIPPQNKSDYLSLVLKNMQGVFDYDYFKSKNSASFQFYQSLIPYIEKLVDFSKSNESDTKIHYKFPVLLFRVGLFYYFEMEKSDEAEVYLKDVIDALKGKDCFSSLSAYANLVVTMIQVKNNQVESNESSSPSKPSVLSQISRFITLPTLPYWIMRFFINERKTDDRIYKIIADILQKIATEQKQQGVQEDEGVLYRYFQTIKPIIQLEAYLATIDSVGEDKDKELNEAVGFVERKIAEHENNAITISNYAGIIFRLYATLGSKYLRDYNNRHDNAALSNAGKHFEGAIKACRRFSIYQHPIFLAQVREKYCKVLQANNKNSEADVQLQEINNIYNRLSSDEQSNIRLSHKPQKQQSSIASIENNSKSVNSKEAKRDRMECDSKSPLLTESQGLNYPRRKYPNSNASTDIASISTSSSSSSSTSSFAPSVENNSKSADSKERKHDSMELDSNNTLFIQSQALSISPKKSPNASVSMYVTSSSTSSVSSSSTNSFFSPVSSGTTETHSTSDQASKKRKLENRGVEYLSNSSSSSMSTIAPS